MDTNITMEDVLQKHRKEIKLLQAEIQKIKKSVPKGDKKRSKEAQLLIANLENELAEKQKQEINGINLVKEMEECELKPEITDNLLKSSRKSRKSKDTSRLYDKLIQNHEEMKFTSERYMECEKIKNKLRDLYLELVEIPADGNCLFNAIGYQCIKKKLLNMPLDFVKNDNLAVHLRNVAYSEMVANTTRYSEFISTDESTDFRTYCQNIRDTRAWGGQLEMNALSSALKCRIEIIQADLPSIIVGDEYDSPTLIITYHKLEYGLGEHYNTCDDAIQLQ